MTDLIKPQTAETRDQKIDRLWEGSGHGTRREDIEAAFAAGESSAQAPAPLLPPPRPNMFWDASDGPNAGGAIVSSITELLEKRASLGLLAQGDELVIDRAIKYPHIKVRVIDSQDLSYELVRERARWPMEFYQPEGKSIEYICEFVDGEAAIFLDDKRIEPDEKVRPHFEALAKRMRQFAYANPGVILGAPV